MTETSAAQALPDLSTMTKLCEERILLCGPCADLMSEEEWHGRHVRLNGLARAWTEEERTDFWYTLDGLCAEGNPAIRATPGLVLTPEVLAAEESRITRIAYERDGEGASEGFEGWGFYLYADPVVYSFTNEEIGRYAMTKTEIVYGRLGLL